LGIQQFRIAAVGTGFGLGTQHPEAGFAFKVLAEAVLHMSIHQYDFVGFKISHVDVRIDAVEHRKQCLVGLPEGLLGLFPYVNLLL
jgi:hypothetical protein